MIRVLRGPAPGRESGRRRGRRTRSMRINDPETPTMDDYKTHPAADLFPLLDGPEFDQLVEDVGAHGLLEPIEVIEVDGEVLILDGRNRWRACIKAGVPVETVTANLDGMTPTQYVLSKNLHRRQLTADQRAQIALDALPHLAEEARARLEARPDMRAANLATRRSCAPNSTDGAYACLPESKP